MKRFTTLTLVFMMFFSNVAYNVSAAVSIGQASKVLQGDYVVIVNTNLENSQSTGSITFDDSGVNIKSIKGTLFNDEVNDTTIEDNDISNVDNEEVSVNTNSEVETVYTIGQEKEIGQKYGTKKKYTLIGIGNKSYIWMENGLKQRYDEARKTELAASEMIKVYEGRPYEILNELAGGNIPYLDKSGKLSILLENTGGSSGFYGNEDDITALHINTKEPSLFKAGGFDGLNGLLTHEGQHALFRLLICGGDATLAHKYNWINEGISVAIMDYVWGYYDNNGWLTHINDSNRIRNGASLLYSDYRSASVLDYSMPYLFVRYLAAQATNNGNIMDFLKPLYKMSAKDKSVETFMDEIISTITNLKGKKFKDVLGSFYVAAFSPEKTGEYSFYGDTVVTEKVSSYPIYLGESGVSKELEPTAAIVVKTLRGSFTVPSDAGSDIKFYAVTKNNDIYKPAIGSGTASDPYIIKTEDELGSIGKYPNAYFKLGSNIEIKKGSFYTAERFSGVLDGNGYTINNLNKPLVGTNSGTIKNLNVVSNFNTDVMHRLGVIAEQNTGSISDIKVTGTLKLNSIVANPVLKPTIGGIVGENQPSGVIERVAFEGEMNVAMPANETIVGGIVGYNTGAIRNTYSKGSINVSEENPENFMLYLAGIIGQHKYMGVGAVLENSYSIMNLNYDGYNSTKQIIGSLVGSVISNATIRDSFGIDKYKSVGNSEDLTRKKSLEELKKQETFTNWDFNATWKMDNQGDRTPIFRTGKDITSISAKLVKNDFFVGEKLSLYGSDILTVNGINIKLTEQMLNMNEFDSSKPATGKVINGSYMGKEFTVTYNIVAPTTVTDLQIVEKGKTDYFEGQKYSDTGVVLKAKLNDSQYYTNIYSGYKNNLSGSLTKENNEVQLSYYGQTVTQTITVKEKSVSSITVFNKADINSYVVGNTVDLTGIRYQINYSDGSKSPILSNKDLVSYNLKVAQTNSEGKDAKVFDLEKKLEGSDNNTKLYIYYGETLPGNKESISAEIMNLGVLQRLYMENQTFRGAIGIEEYWDTEAILNADYDVKTTLISGSLPEGIELYSSPNHMYDNFSFGGSPTQIGIYNATYRITKNDKSDSIDVTFTFNIEEVSKEAKIEKIFLYKSDNKKLAEDIEGVIDHQNGTIKFVVPKGTDVSKLIARPTFYKNSTLPSNFKWFAGLDFTNSVENPILYEVTAEDGKTTKTYKVSVEVLKEDNAVTSIDIDNKISDIKSGETYAFVARVNGFGNFNKNVIWKVEGASSLNTTIDNNGNLTIGEDEANSSIRVVAISSGDESKTIEISINVIKKEQLPKVEELVWDRRLAKWAAILNAKTYEVNLYKDDQLVQTITVSTNEYDLTEVIRKLGAGEYSFTVVAMSNGYLSSEESNKSEVFSFKNDKPEIKGANNVEVEYGSEFNERSGVTATDLEDNDLTESIIVEGSVDTSSLGNHILKYSVTDSDNNTTTVERVVTVIDESTPKLDDITNLRWDGKIAVWDSVANATRYRLKLYRNNNIVVEKVIDTNGEEILSVENKTNSISFDLSEYFVESGEYKFTVVAEADGYASSSVAGENSTENKNEFVNNAPEIIAVNKTIKVNTVFNELDGVTAFDVEDGDITKNIKVIKNNVKVNTEGTYEVVYEVSDKEGLKTTKTIIVTVVSNERPIITGANDIEIYVGSNFDIKSGVEATDKEDGILTSNIVVSGNFNPNEEGIYEITYSVTDKDGNITTLVRRITVIKQEQAESNPGNESGNSSENISENISENESGNQLENVVNNAENELPKTGGVSTVPGAIFGMILTFVGIKLNKRKR